MSITHILSLRLSPGKLMWSHYYFTAGRGTVLWSVYPFVCMSVCLSVCMSASVYQRPRVQTLEIFCTLPVTTAQSSSDGSAVIYVIPVLSMSSWFPVIGQIQMQACSLQRSKLFAVTPQVVPLNCTSGRGELQMVFNVSREFERDNVFKDMLMSIWDS